MSLIFDSPEIGQTGEISSLFVESKPCGTSLFVDAADNVWQSALTLEAEWCGLTRDYFVAVEGNDEGEFGPIFHRMLDEESDAHFIFETNKNV